MTASKLVIALLVLCAASVLLGSTREGYYPWWRMRSPWWMRRTYRGWPAYRWPASGWWWSHASPWWNRWNYWYRYSYYPYHSVY